MLSTPVRLDGTLYRLGGTTDPAIADYDPIAHLNTIFSHPSTISAAPGVSRALSAYQHDLDSDIASLVAKQTTSDEDSIGRIKAAQAELADLFKKIEGVRERALRTEQTITEMTADIKRLDGTKRNLTLSMTALKRLQMLTTAYEQLRSLCKTRQYKECAQLLQAVVQLMAHFKSYRSIDQIAVLGRKVADLQREMLEQVSEDFETAFSKSEVAQKRAVLAEGCLVMDALGENARSRLVTWYCNTTLREYRQIFHGNDEVSVRVVRWGMLGLMRCRPVLWTTSLGDSPGSIASSRHTSRNTPPSSRITGESMKSWQTRFAKEPAKTSGQSFSNRRGAPMARVLMLISCCHVFSKHWTLSMLWNAG